MPVPILDLTPELDALGPALHEALERVLRSGHFILGPDVGAFEQDVAAYLGVRHAIGLNSGTDALFIGLRALGIQPGDEVITTTFSFFATAESVSLLGAKPVFVDVEEESFNLDVTQLEAAITEKTRAIVPVHLFGRPANMTAVLEVAARHGLKVLEDCAQSFGARVDTKLTGTLGHAGAYSFFPSKNLGAYGDGGLLATNDDEVARVARMLRAHGSAKKYHNEMVGYNSRLDTIQAAVLRVKLPHIEAYNAGRRRVAQRYNEAFADLGGLIVPELTEGHVFHQYTLRVVDGKRDALAQYLAGLDIQTMVYYPIPQDRLPIYAGQYPRFPVSDLLAEQVLSLPIWPQMKEQEQAIVLEAVRAFFSS
ncbi:MAG: DegT/DnrJ/EryC1/StrS family aminotransferase [Rhodothermales bacterium]|nr:DegT/DnrJ/EryC1/StrS family aminotransferase [Rhodothermales bacterium]